MTGPPPPDVAAATAAIEAALTDLVAPHDGDVPTLEGGEGLGPLFGLARERSSHLVGDDPVLLLDEARFLHQRLAEIRVRIVVPALGHDLPLSGFAFERDGRWLVSRETGASLLALGGVSLPPRTVGLAPAG